jgi:hypothetical protein
MKKIVKTGITEKAQTNGSPVSECNPLSCGIAQLREARHSQTTAPAKLNVSRT